MYTQTKDEFLTKILGKSVFNVSPIESGGLFEHGDLFSFKINTLYCCKVKDKDDVDFLVSNGFNLIVTEVTFEGYSGFPRYDITYPSIIEPTVDNFKRWIGYSGIYLMVKDVFTNDRFHKDLKINRELAENIKFEWILNGLTGKRGNRAFVAIDKDKEPMGFLIAIEKFPNVIVDLIGVNKEYQGKKVGSALMRKLVIEYPGWKVQSGTQIDNIGAIKLYHKFGINELVDYKYVLHRHT